MAVCLLGDDQNDGRLHGAQLHTYAIAYRQLKGESADPLEVLNLDEKGQTKREPVNDPLLTAVRNKIRDAGERLRTNNLPRLPTWEKHACGSCDVVGLCRSRQGG